MTVIDAAFDTFHTADCRAIRASITIKYRPPLHRFALFFELPGPTTTTTTNENKTNRKKNRIFFIRGSRTDGSWPQRGPHGSPRGSQTSWGTPTWGSWPPRGSSVAIRIGPSTVSAALLGGRGGEGKGSRPQNELGKPFWWVLPRFWHGFFFLFVSFFVSTRASARYSGLWNTTEERKKEIKNPIDRKPTPVVFVRRFVSQDFWNNRRRRPFRAGARSEDGIRGRVSATANSADRFFTQSSPARDPIVHVLRVCFVFFWPTIEVEMAIQKSDNNGNKTSTFWSDLVQKRQSMSSSFRFRVMVLFFFKRERERERKRNGTEFTGRSEQSTEVQIRMAKWRTRRKETKKKMKKMKKKNKRKKEERLTGGGGGGDGGVCVSAGGPRATEAAEASARHSNRPKRNKTKTKSRPQNRKSPVRLLHGSAHHPTHLYTYLYIYTVYSDHHMTINHRQSIYL